jgi:methyl-accepting chemotaxis protein
MNGVKVEARNLSVAVSVQVLRRSLAFRFLPLRSSVDVQSTDRQNVDKMTENVDKMTENVDKMTENVDKMTENVDKMTENVNKMTGNVYSSPKGLGDS